MNVEEGHLALKDEIKFRCQMKLSSEGENIWHLMDCKKYRVATRGTKVGRGRSSIRAPQ